MRKNRITAIAAGALAGVMLLGVTASAAPELKVGLSNNTYYVDGQQVDLTTYKINGNNYVKLRDVGELVDFGVEYDAKTGKVTIDPDAVYTPETTQTPKAYNDVSYKTISLKESDPNYYKELWAAEYYNYRKIKDFPTLYVAAAWDNYLTAANTLGSMNPEALTEADIAKIVAAKEAREVLNKNQIKPLEDGINGEVIYIWDKGKMPITTKDVQGKFDTSKWDNSDFAPFIIPYLLSDPGSAKGTVIVVSGGGNQSRSNAGEGYKVCPEFNRLGYNCFLLQRRVDPYLEDEIVMDLQRTIRYVKYHAKEWGIDLENTLLATNGYSGGAGNVMVQISKFYGDITPDKYDSTYVCDEIDKLNSDVDVAIPIYGGGALNADNPNIPALFLGIGADDNIVGPDNIIGLYQEAKKLGIDTELQIYAKNGHGFGPGTKGTSSANWMKSADLFMQKVMGYAEVGYTGEIPEQFTLKQTVVLSGVFPTGDCSIDVYKSADGGEFLMTFFVFGEDQCVQGILINNRVADVTFDKSGYFAGDAPKIWELCDPSAWEPVK